MIRLDVIGDPAPQGSKRVFNGRIVEQMDKTVKAWRGCVIAASPSERHLLDVPVTVSITFWMRRPAKPKFPDHPAVPPDIDKLARSTLDALVMAGVIRDDSRIVNLTVTKEYAVDRAPGATILVGRVQ